MNPDDLAASFEASRDHLLGVAYRMLGSLSDADDAVQQAWLRASRTDRSEIVNVAAWLTTVTSRVCLDLLRSRRQRNESPLTSVPVDHVIQTTPEDEAVLAESVGLALLVVLDRLSPDQRIAFVLHDLFAMPFEQIAVVVDRSTAATKKLASRARHQVRGATTVRADRAEHRAVVDAFLAASQGGDIDTLLELLASDVIRRADRFATPAGVAGEVRGARAVAEETKAFATRARTAEAALVDGTPGIIIAPVGKLFAVVAITIDNAHITELDVIADPATLAQTNLALAPRHITTSR